MVGYFYREVELPRERQRIWRQRILTLMLIVLSAWLALLLAVGLMLVPIASTPPSRPTYWPAAYVEPEAVTVDLRTLGPTLPTCGDTVWADHAGRFMSAMYAECTVYFREPYTVTPSCWVSSEGPSAYSYVVSQTALTLTAMLPSAGATYDFVCDPVH